MPTHGLYPFQWNWDSCLTALGQLHRDEDRAWTEIETLFDHQWEDGMVPHIIFHKEDDGYFRVLISGLPDGQYTSGITAGGGRFAVARMFERAKDRAMASARAAKLLPKIANGMTGSTGVVIRRNRSRRHHSSVGWGRDNPIDWDEAFSVCRLTASPVSAS